MNRSKKLAVTLTCCLATCLLGVVTVNGPALAQRPPSAAKKPVQAAAPPAAPKDRADELFEQAVAAIDAGRLQEAETKLEEAWALKKTHDISGNLGIVELKLGKPREAVEHLAEALQRFPPTESEKGRAVIRQKLAEARAQIGALRIRATVDGAQVIVNGREAGVTPLTDEVYVDPGKVNVIVRRDGYLVAQEVVTIAKGDGTRELSVTLVPLGSKPEGRSIVPGVVLGSVAGAALVTGVVLLVEGATKRSDARDLSGAIRDAHRGCIAGAASFDARCSDLSDTARAAGRFHNTGVGMLIGAGALGAATLLYFVWPASSRGAPSAYRLVPSASPTSGSLLFSGSF